MHTSKLREADRNWNAALWLAIFTILYNLVEGLVSVYFGSKDESLTLFGFGLDSFIEVMSGIGILAMVLRIRRNPESERGEVEGAALKITGTAFYVLAAGLMVTAAYNVITQQKPSTTVPGLIISLVSMGVMWALVRGKRQVGDALACAPILADANCTLVCIYMSAVLLASSFIYQISGFGFADSLGAIGLIYFSIHEGREAFERASEAEDGAAANSRESGA